MKKILFTIFLSLLVITGCKSISNKKLGGASSGQTEGWINDNTFEIVVVGGWDRDRYYIEDEADKLTEDQKEGKVAKSLLLLQRDSKESAIAQAQAQFKEKMGVYIKRQVGVDEGTLLADVVQTEVSGISVRPYTVQENYTPKGDARLSTRFEADGLKATVDKIATSALKKKSNTDVTE